MFSILFLKKYTAHKTHNFYFFFFSLSLLIYALISFDIHTIFQFFDRYLNIQYIHNRKNQYHACAVVGTI